MTSMTMREKAIAELRRCQVEDAPFIVGRVLYVLAEPTEEMVTAGEAAFDALWSDMSCTASTEDIRATWAAMVKAASGSPPAPDPVLPSTASSAEGPAAQ